MPEFVNPFSGEIPSRANATMSKEELIRAIRLDIAAEHEAVHLYTAHAEVAGDALAKKVLLDVANEEREHIGEFERLLQILTGDEDKWTSRGAEEVNEMASEIDARMSAQPTVGSLRE